MSKGEAVEVEEVNLESLFGDGKIMAEIEEKAKSKKKEDILEALGLFEKNWDQFLLGHSMYSQTIRNKS